MLEISLSAAGLSFVAGLLMFFAPCTFPLVPAFLSIISGEDRGKGMVSKVGVFCLGFSLVFILLGIFSSYLGQSIYWLGYIFTKFSGLILIFLGLVMLRIINLNVFAGVKSFRIPRYLKPGTHQSSFFLGVAFSFGWSPCVGPLLATLLVMASSEEYILSGGLLLAVFSLGLSTPFILSALFFESVKDKLQKVYWLSRLFSTITGILVLILGVALVADELGTLTAYGESFYRWLNLDVLFTFM